MSLFKTIRRITSHPMNRGHELDSIMRFTKWQIGSRLTAGPIVHEWVNGTKFLVKTGEKGLTGNIYMGLHEFPDMGFVLHFLRPEDLFVDVGANSGSYSILAGAAVGAKGLAFEPVPATYTRLVENMRLNRLDDRVQCINKGVGAQEGTITFNIDDDTRNHALAPDEQCSEKTIVEMITLDAALRGDNPSLLKIDVEGYEIPVLEGAAGVLRERSLKAVIVELNGSGRRYGFEESVILDLMDGEGFELCSYDPFGRSLASAHAEDITKNALFVRDRTFVEQRLVAAPKARVHGRQI